MQRSEQWPLKIYTGPSLTPNTKKLFGTYFVGSHHGDYAIKEKIYMTKLKTSGGSTVMVGR